MRAHEGLDCARVREAYGRVFGVARILNLKSFSDCFSSQQLNALFFSI